MSSGSDVEEFELCTDAGFLSKVVTVAEDVSVFIVTRCRPQSLLLFSSRWMLLCYGTISRFSVVDNLSCVDSFRLYAPRKYNSNQQSPTLMEASWKWHVLGSGMS